jgi:hypothetical protein
MWTEAHGSAGDNDIGKLNKEDLVTAKKISLKNETGFRMEFS